MERGYHSTSCKFQVTGKLVNGKIWANKVRSQLFLYSYFLFPLLVMWATFIQRGIIETEQDITSILWRTIKDDFCHSNHWFNITEVTIPPSPWHVPHSLGTKGPSFCTRSLGIVLVKADCDLAQGSTYMEGSTYPCRWQQDRTSRYCSCFTFHLTSLPMLQKNRALGIASLKTQ